MADDYFSQASSLEDGEQNEHYEHSRKELLIKQLERNENRIKNVLRPYILPCQDYDLGDFKGVAFAKRPLIRQPLARMSFGGHTGEWQPFPISVLKLKKVETKVDIKDVVDKLVELAHGSTLPKKVLIE